MSDSLMRKYTVEVLGQPLVIYDNTGPKICDQCCQPLPVPRITEESSHAAYSLWHNDPPRAVLSMIEVYDTINRFGIKSALEVFGGTGWGTLAINQSFECDKHVIWDSSETACMGLVDSFPSLGVECCDSYKAIANVPDDSFDFVCADFNAITLMKLRKSEADQAFVKNAFRVAKKALLYTDSAAFGISRFPKNRQAYADAFGMDPDNWKDYYRVLDEEFGRLYGWRLIEVHCWAGKSAHLMFIPSAAHDGSPWTFHVASEKADRKIISVEVAEQ